MEQDHARAYVLAKLADDFAEHHRRRCDTIIVIPPERQVEAFLEAVDKTGRSIMVVVPMIARGEVDDDLRDRLTAGYRAVMEQGHPPLGFSDAEYFANLRHVARYFQQSLIAEVDKGLN